MLVRAGVVIKSGDWKEKIYYIAPRPIQSVFAELARRARTANLHKYGSPYSPFD